MTRVRNTIEATGALGAVVLALYPVAGVMAAAVAIFLLAGTPV